MEALVEVLKRLHDKDPSLFDLTHYEDYADYKRLARAIAAENTLAVDSLTDEQCEDVTDVMVETAYGSVELRAALRRCATGEPK